MKIDKYGRDIEKIKHQIDAGTVGRKRGHSFEKVLAEEINKLDISKFKYVFPNEKHIFQGDPAILLLKYIINNKKIVNAHSVKAWWFGGLATAQDGDIFELDGKKITSSKSDVVIKITDSNGEDMYIGISVKDCNTESPTNDQVHFTTARAFCKLLRNNGLEVSEKVENALRKFCGDNGFRPSDISSSAELKERKSTPDRFFLEEVGEQELQEITTLFNNNQRKITEIVLKFAYEGDVFPPEFILHKTTNHVSKDGVTVSIHSMDELLDLSERFSRFELKPYKIRKGTWKSDSHTHFAPQLGFIQIQRKGSKKNATQLQFNLKAGYFNFEPNNESISKL